VKKLGVFIAIGSVFATVEEFLTVVILKRDLMAYLLTIVVVFPVFLTFVFYSSRWLDRMFQKEANRELAHLIVYGLVGLMFEWFCMGLAPWNSKGGTGASVLMLLFQIGMFCFWSSVAFAPRLFLGAHALNQIVKRRILWFYIPYFTLTYAVGLSVPAELRFVTIIVLIIIGYIVLNLFFVSYLVQAHASASEMPVVVPELVPKCNEFRCDSQE
jgi:hypothetical protein